MGVARTRGSNATTVVVVDLVHDGGGVGEWRGRWDKWMWEEQCFRIEMNSAIGPYKGAAIYPRA